MCFFRWQLFEDFRNSLSPPKTKMTMENPTIWRCISYWKWWIFHCRVSFGEVTLRSKLCLESPFVFLCSLKAGSFDKVKSLLQEQSSRSSGVSREVEVIFAGPETNIATMLKITNLVGGWFQPIWNICNRQIGSWNPKFRGENKKYVKPPPSKSCGDIGDDEILWLLATLKFLPFWASPTEKITKKHSQRLEISKWGGSHWKEKAVKIWANYIEFHNNLNWWSHFWKDSNPILKKSPHFLPCHWENEILDPLSEGRLSARTFLPRIQGSLPLWVQRGR